MSNKKFRSQTRLNDIERRQEMHRNELLRTADRSSVNAAKRHIIWCRTFDDGNYPQSPGSGAQQEHVLPVVFDDATYNLTPGPASITRQALDIQRMDYALCSQWYPPGTAVPVFHQNRRWFESSAGSQTALQKILWAFATIEQANACVDPLPVENLVYRPWGIFQLPWDDYVPSGGQTWSEGDDKTWSENDEQISWSASSGKFDADNPLKICGEQGDLVLLTYQGEGIAPLVVEVIHKCHDIQQITYNPATCNLEYKDLGVCSPVYSQPTAGPATVLIDFEVQTFVTDVGWDPAKCTLYNVYEDFCVIRIGNEQVLDWLDFRDIQDPCCPCPECPSDCSGCASAYLITINSWSTPDCGCMNFIQRALNQLVSPNCKWDTSDAICDAGAFIALIECVNNRWILTMQYSTSGTASDVDVAAEPIDMGPASACPPTGTYTPVWIYDPLSTICITNASQVVIE